MVETEGNMDLKPFIFLKLLVMESSRLWFELLEWKGVQCAVKEGFLFEKKVLFFFVFGSHSY